MFQKYMKETFIINYTITLIKIDFQNTTQDALLFMIVKMKIALDKKKVCMAVLTVSVMISSLLN